MPLMLRACLSLMIAIRKLVLYSHLILRIPITVKKMVILKDGYILGQQQMFAEIQNPSHSQWISWMTFHQYLKVFPLMNRLFADSCPHLLMSLPLILQILSNFFTSKVFITDMENLVLLSRGHGLLQMHVEMYLRRFKQSFGYPTLTLSVISPCRKVLNAIRMVS